jgi:hypothetical protein
MFRSSHSGVKRTDTPEGFSRGAHFGDAQNPLGKFNAACAKNIRGSPTIWVLHHIQRICLSQWLIRVDDGLDEMSFRFSSEAHAHRTERSALLDAGTSPNVDMTMHMGSSTTMGSMGSARSMERQSDDERTGVGRGDSLTDTAARVGDQGFNTVREGMREVMDKVSIWLLSVVAEGD